MLSRSQRAVRPPVKNDMASGGRREVMRGGVEDMFICHLSSSFARTSTKVLIIGLCPLVAYIASCLLAQKAKGAS